MDNFAKMSTTHAQFAMRTAWVQWGRASAPFFCIQGQHTSLAFCVFHLFATILQNVKFVYGSVYEKTNKEKGRERKRKGKEKEKGRGNKCRFCAGFNVQNLWDKQGVKASSPFCGRAFPPLLIAGR
jgi:hypothetical protein